MVSASLQATVERLSIGDRLELIAYIEATLDAPELTDEQENLIRSRDAELDADPSLMESRAEHDAFVRALRSR
ncbi:MAG: hypothetical protein LBQ06_05345 [Frankiaceae bacterium]|jgi:hypothetical protein|nr:hypothetical protein [Frankiaceae bacterium]